MEAGKCYMIQRLIAVWAATGGRGRCLAESANESGTSPGMTVGNGGNPGPPYPRWVPALIGTLSPVTSSAPAISQTMASATSSATILRLSGAEATKPDSTFS